MTLLAWCVAWILDVVIGDPPHWPHPVRWIGRLIAVSQRVVRRVCHSDRALRIGGGVMWLVVFGPARGGGGGGKPRRIEKFFKRWRGMWEGRYGSGAVSPAS
ncbi:cobalamin biosynthesis protein, partial [Klebsiella pneumoniae]|nr:cobalamin biosynthesis protein [Klebsiella pneumoniae]